MISFFLVILFAALFKSVHVRDNFLKEPFLIIIGCLFYLYTADKNSQLPGGYTSILSYQ